MDTHLGPVLDPDGTGFFAPSALTHGDGMRTDPPELYTRLNASAGQARLMAWVSAGRRLHPPR